MTYLLTAAVIVLAVNLVAAVAGAARGGERDGWLVGVLISGTAGAGILAVASQLFAAPDLLEAALALMALALVIVVARSAAQRLGRPGSADHAGTRHEGAGEQDQQLGAREAPG